MEVHGEHCSPPRFWPWIFGQGQTLRPRPQSQGRQGQGQPIARRRPRPQNLALRPRPRTNITGEEREREKKSEKGKGFHHAGVSGALTEAWAELLSASLWHQMIDRISGRNLLVWSGTPTLFWCGVQQAVTSRRWRHRTGRRRIVGAWCQASDSDEISGFSHQIPRSPAAAVASASPIVKTKIANSRRLWTTQKLENIRRGPTGKQSRK